MDHEMLQPIYSKSDAADDKDCPESAHIIDTNNGGEQ
jgi:hypothetical protein